MNRTLILLFLIYSSCGNAGKKVLRSDKTHDSNTKELRFLYTYKTSKDTIKEGLVIQYATLGLSEERSGAFSKFYLDNREVLSINDRQFSSLLQVFDDKYLVVSFVKHNTYGVAGPDLFKRDSVCILNLKSQKLAMCNLKDRLLTTSKDLMIENYKFLKEDQLENRRTRFTVIDSIDFQNQKIVLLNQSLKREVFKLTPQVTPFSISN